MGHRVGDIHKGGCACGQVRFEAIGQPIRVGVCHCLLCRKHHGAAFNPFVVYPVARVFVAGSLKSWRSSSHASRLSCPACSSPICQQEDDSDEIELHLGSFDETSLFSPMYENWAVHREDWLPHMGLLAHSTDLPVDELEKMPLRRGVAEAITKERRHEQANDIAELAKPSATR